MARRETTLLFTYEDDDGNEVEVHVPFKWEICDRCRGDSTHVNPSIDGNGITASEWEEEWDDESREMYMSGGYDVACHDCGGSSKVKEPDESVLTEDERRRWDKHCEDEMHYRMMCEAERRMGA